MKIAITKLGIQSKRWDNRLVCCTKQTQISANKIYNHLVAQTIDARDTTQLIPRLIGQFITALIRT